MFYLLHMWHNHDDTIVQICHDVHMYTYVMVKVFRDYRFLVIKALSSNDYVYGNSLVPFCRNVC